MRVVLFYAMDDTDTMKLTKHTEMLNRHIGKVETLERDEFDRKVKAEIEVYKAENAKKAMSAKIHGTPV